MYSLVPLLSGIYSFPAMSSLLVTIMLWSEKPWWDESLLSSFFPSISFHVMSDHLAIWPPKITCRLPEWIRWNWHFRCQISDTNRSVLMDKKWNSKIQNWHLSFIKWTPGDISSNMLSSQTSHYSSISWGKVLPFNICLFFDWILTFILKKFIIVPKNTWYFLRLEICYKIRQMDKTFI